MVDYEYGTLFNDDSVKKEIIIKYGNTTITNEDLFNQELELDESLCSEEQLKFGSCEASVIKFRVANIVSPVKGNWISVGMAIDGHAENPIQLGRYKVESDKPTSDRKWREIVAYDALYDMINNDVSPWYNSVLPNKNTSMTLSQFRNLFLQKYGVQEESGDPLVNDGMVVTRTIDPEELSGAKVITAICELNGCFGHIDRNGKFKSVQLIQGIKGLYPRNDLYPADDIYPRDPKSTPIGKGIYISCEYEDFTVNSITGVDIYKEENALGGSSGSPENKYVVEDNFLVYGKSEQEISAIANNLLSVIRGLDYRPFDAECKGNPCFEVGDPVRFSTKYEIVESYILSRTLKGTQALKDSYSTDGTEKYEIKVNSARRETAQLSGKTEQLERVSEEQQEHINSIDSDIDAISKDITEVEEKVEENRVTITKTEDSISTKVAGSVKEWDTSKYTIKYYGYDPPTTTYPPINESSIGKYYLDENTGKVYHCARDASGIRWGWPEKYTNQKITYRGKGEPHIGYPPTETDDIGAYYLDQSSGKLYRCARDASGIRWGWPVQLQQVTVQLHSSIEQTDESIRMEVSRAQNAENSLSSRINIEAGNIALEVERAKGAESSLSSRINMTESSIDLEVQRAQSAESNLSSRISMTESNINLKVSKGEIISAINLSPEAVDIDASKINLNGAITANGNFKVNLDGTVESNSGVFTNSVFYNGIYFRIYGYGDYPVLTVPRYGELYVANSATHTHIEGSLGVVGAVHLPGAQSMTTSADANVVFSGGYLYKSTGSLKKWKHSISDIRDPSIDAHLLYNVKPRQFVYNNDYLPVTDKRSGKFIPGFIVDELIDDYPIAVEYNENGEPENWGAKFFIVPMIQLIQEHKAKLDDHDGLINRIIKKIGGI